MAGWLVSGHSDSIKAKEGSFQRPWLSVWNSDMNANSSRVSSLVPGLPTGRCCAAAPDGSARQWLMIDTDLNASL